MSAPKGSCVPDLPQDAEYTFSLRGGICRFNSISMLCCIQAAFSPPNSERAIGNASLRSGAPQIGSINHSTTDRPGGALAPYRDPREVRPKPHPKGSYSETITTSSPSISSAGTAPKVPSPAWKTTIETMSVAAREAAKA